MSNAGNIVGNASPGTGSGGSYKKSALGHITINGKTGDDFRISLAEILLKADTMYQGVYVQVLGGEVDFYTTLAPVDIAENPGQDTGGHWVSMQAVTTTAITKITNPTTVLRVKFIANAVVHILGF